MASSTPSSSSGSASNAVHNETTVLAQGSVVRPARSRYTVPTCRLGTRRTTSRVDRPRLLMTRLIAAARSSGREIRRGPRRLVPPAPEAAASPPSADVGAPWFASTIDVRSMSLLLLWPRRPGDARFRASSYRTMCQGRTFAKVPLNRSVIHAPHDHAAACPTPPVQTEKYVI